MSEEVTPFNVSFQLPDLMSVLSSLGLDSLETTGGGLLSGDEPSLKLSFNTFSNKLCLTLKEDKGVTEAQVATFDDDEKLIVFPPYFSNKVTVNVEPIIDFWKCCDLSSEFIQVSNTVPQT